MILKPHVYAQRVERVFADAELPDLFAVGKQRQAHRALCSDFLNVGFLLVLELRNYVVFVLGVGFSFGGAGGGGGGPVGSPAKRVWRELDGEEEGVDESRDGDNRDEAEDKFKGGEVDAPRRCWERWRWFV